MRAPLALTLLVVLTVLSHRPAGAAEATGKVVFVDSRHHGLLIEVPQDGGGIPGAKEGETFTFVVPAPLSEAAKALREGEVVTVSFEEREKDGPRLVALEKVGVPVPRSWKDLFDPKYKGLVAYDDPTIHGTAWEVTFAANLAMGGDTKNLRPGIDYLRNLHGNIVSYSRETSYNPALRGEIAIWLHADGSGYKMKWADGGPIEVVIPAEGTGAVPLNMGMVKWTKRPRLAAAYLDWLLSPEAPGDLGRLVLAPDDQGVHDRERQAEDEAAPRELRRGQAGLDRGQAEDPRDLPEDVGGGGAPEIAAARAPRAEGRCATGSWSRSCSCRSSSASPPSCCTRSPTWRC